MLRKNNCKLYGYEDYKLYDISMYNLIKHGTASANRYYYLNYTNMLPIDKSMLDIHYTFDVRALEIEESPEALDNAKRLYIHPSCTISRDIVRKKFNTCLNVAVADALIVPTPNKHGVDVLMAKAVFINEELKEVYTIDLSYCKENPESADDNAFYKVERKIYNELLYTPVGTLFKDLQHPIVHTYNSDVKGLENAEFLSMGPMAHFTKSDKYLFDFATLTLPKNRIVFQETLMKALGDESNTPTAESMCNIYDMMVSEDRSVRELGLKTLATLDYIHYPESTRAILDYTNWRVDNNYNTTAVKFMLNALDIRSGARSRKMEYSDEISAKDWEVYKPLIHHIRNFRTDIEWVKFCLELSFTYVDNSTNVVPNLKYE